MNGANIMHKRPVFSIIVPVYNVEKYVFECLESIKHQSYSDFEVIIVDDGSKDNSTTICEDYCKDDERFHYYRKINGGVSSARNYGLRRAQGDWILFVDSDDQLNDALLQRCLDRFNDCSCGLVLFQYEFMSENGERLEPGAFSGLIPASMNGHDSVEYLCKGLFDDYPWSFVARKSVYVDNNITFPEGKRMEDSATTYKLLYNASTVSYIAEPLYRYRRRSGSITSAVDKYYLSDYVEVIDNSLIGIIKLCPDCFDVAVYRSVAQVLNCLGIIDHLSEKNVDDTIVSLRKVLLSRIRGIPIRHIFIFLSFKEMVKIAIIKIHLDFIFPILFGIELK